MFFSALLFSMMSFAGVVTFDADVDKGNAGTDSNNAAAYTITKDGVTVEVSSGILGTYNNEMHYRIYKNQTLKITSAAGNITSVQFTCTANDAEKYGPGCFTVDGGDYTYAGPVGTWTGSATEITFTASANQVRATQIVVATDGAEIPDQPEEPETPETPDVPAPEGVITCAEALAICEATGETSTTETYTIRAYVTGIKTAYSEQYGNISLWLADTPDGGQVLQAFRVKPVNDADINVAVGDFVEVVGTLVNYMGNTPEVNAGGTYTIITAGSGETPETPDVPTPDGVITCAEALAICEATGETSTTESYTIRGYVTEIKTVYSEQYGNISFWMADTPDGGKVLQAYRVKPVNAADINVAVGDFVEVVGTLVNYMGNTPEVNQGGTYTIVTPGSGETPENPETPETPETPEGAIVFDADEDMGNASTDYNNAAAYEVEKNGVIMSVSSGVIGTYNNENHYRIYKNQTLVLTSTVGNITSVSFTCTANDAEKYGPGCLTVDGGEYTYSGAVGTWTGSAAEITFSAAVNQVRATQIVVTIEGGATPTDVVNVKDLSYADAYYYEEEGSAFWEIQLYNVDEEAEEIMMPIMAVGIEAKSKTALNGEYDLLLALYGTSVNENDEIEGVWNDETIAATLTIKNVDNDNNYSFVGTFVGEDGKTYKINTVANVYAIEDATEEVIELKEDGNNDPVTPPAEGVITCAEAVAICEATGSTLTTETYTIRGYVTEIKYAWSEQYGTATFWIADTKDGGKVLQAYSCAPVTDADKEFAVGAYVELVGKLKQYNTTSEVERGTYTVITPADGGTGVEDVVTVEVPVKVIENGQLMIIRGETVYNVLGAQVK